ncbi:unnamed protein product [Cuscuta epithymum]|uniref:Uncharacterized protein n=1 Tax=Cuscuta epithymum TaxID=186058 RepID=A0AAV0D7F2_9ASTE|nr:unnamed protein product [Cuscuta epithymum]
MDGDENNPVQNPSISPSSSSSSDFCGGDFFSSEEEEEEHVSPSCDEPLQTMSALLQDLPFKKGLSKHYNGKSQSFTSLTNVRSVEDLAKPENPYNKRLKGCRSYAGLFLEGCKRSSCNGGILKKSSTRAGGGGFCSSLSSSRKNGSGKNRLPPPPPASAANFANHTPLFA